MVWDSSLAKDDSPDAWLSTLALPNIFFWSVRCPPITGHGGLLLQVSVEVEVSLQSDYLQLPDPFGCWPFQGWKQALHLDIFGLFKGHLEEAGTWILLKMICSTLCYVTSPSSRHLGDYVWKFFQASNKQIQDYKQPWAPQTYLLRGLAGK